MGDSQVNRKVTIALVMVLTMILMPWSAILVAPELEEERGPSWATGTSIASQDTMLNVTGMNTTHGSASNLNLTTTPGAESRLLFTFPVLSNVTGGVVPAANLVESASMTLSITSASSQGAVYAFVAGLNGEYFEVNATWYNRSNSTTWQGPGASGDTDHENWEPRSQITSGATSVSLNVTALVQQVLAKQATHLNVIVSMTGLGMYTIASSEHPTTNKRPSLSITHATIAAPTPPAVTLETPTDGSVSMSPNFLLSADLTPTMTWSGHSGSGVELQVSRSEDFRQENDSGWLWDSWTGSGFSLSGSNGTYTVPSGTSLNEGMVANWRMRSTDSDQLSAWEYGQYLIPEHSVTDNGNGSAELEMYRDSLNMSRGTVEDAWLRSASPTTPGGNQENMWVGHSNNTSWGEMKIAFRADIPDTGLHTNATILSAYMQLRRTDRQGDPWISIHELTTDNWSESDATWDNYSLNQSWASGSLMKNIGKSLDVQNGNKSGPTFKFDVTYAVQEYVRAGNAGGYGVSPGISFLLSGPSSGNEWARFGGSEDSAFTYRPKMIITYAWGDGVGPSDTVTVQSPLDGQGVWSIVNNNNLTADLTPALNWSTTGHATDDVRIEFASNAEFTEGPLYRVDSRDLNSGVDTANGTFTVPASWGVDYGEDYYWRVRWVEDDDWGDYDTARGFFASTVNSTWVSNNTWEIRLRHSNASNSMATPFCADTYIDSLGPGASNNGGELSITSSQYSLVGCDIRSHTLPPGLAVIDAELLLEASYVSGSLSASVYEMMNHRWEESSATWENYDTNNNWTGVGASGSDRGQLLDSTTIDTLTSTASWNVTIAVQNSMRWNVPVDLLLTGTGSGQAVMFDRENAATAADYPELVIKYSPGSMEVPNPPNPVAPINGAWSVTSGMLIAPEARPTLSWNHSGTITANGWLVELDTTSTFNSNNYRVARSWVQINDFDVTNMTYTPSSNLSTGEVWFWRARGSSQTNQLGNWSSTADFVVPNIESGSLDSDNSYIVIRPGDAVSTQNIPNVPDTWITAGSNRNDTHSAASNLVVGCQSNGCPKVSMLSFPLSELPQPANSRIVGAELSLWAYTVNTSSSGKSPRVSVHHSLRNWSDAANGVSWNGDMSNNSTTNWTTTSGIGGNDVGPLVDIGEPTSSSRFRLNVTEIVHAALADGDSRVNMSLRSDTNLYAEALFYSADYTWATSRPALKIWYRNGTGTSSSTAAWPVTPTMNNITWDLSGHALESEQQPTLGWNHNSPSTIDGWRIFTQNNSNDVRDGYNIHDSRIDSGFDVQNMTWTPPSQFELDAQQRWFVQSITDDMYGPRSSSYTFDVPNIIGWEINSTDARLRVQEGSAVSRLFAPTSFTDAMLNSYSQNSNSGNSQTLEVGRSPSTSNTNFHSTSVMKIDISSLPVPTPWEVIDANVELYCTGCGGPSSTPLDIAVSELNSDFVEMQTTYNRAAINQSWPNPMASGIIDEVPVAGIGWYGWNITQLVQAARLRGDDTVLLQFTAARGSSLLKQFHSSEYSVDQDLRPVLNITHRTGTQWLPADATSPDPATASTLWQASEARPTGRDPVTIQWAHPAPSNITSWQIELSEDGNFDPDETRRLDSSDSTSYSGSFSGAPLSYTISMPADLPSGTAWGDRNFDWRIRPVVGDLFGNWTRGGMFRVPLDQGSDDGLGNHTVTMSRGSVFVQSGILPSVPDTWVDSTPGAGTGTSQGSNTSLVVGASPFQAGQESVGLIQFDLGELPFPSTMLATTVSLKMYRVGYSQSGNPSVTVHDCSSFSESDTWSSFSISNNCNGTASSSVSLSASGFGQWYDWDVTSLVQAAGYNGTVSMALKTNWTGYLQFASSESAGSIYRPQLVIGYIDNLNGTSPPATPVQIFPQDQQVLYEVDDYDDFLLDSPARPTLSWQYDSSTTGYILTLFNTTTSSTIYSWNATSSMGSFGQGNFTPGWDMAAGEGYYWNVQAINGSVLGPRSSTWSFAIGDPDTTYQGNNIWNAAYREGGDASVFNYPQIEDTYISEGDQSETHGSDQLVIGEGCDGGPSNQNQCVGIFQIDLGQIPLTADGRSHSAELNLWISATNTATSSYVDVRVYTLLNPNFSEHQANWIQASLGNSWGGTNGGLLPGVDRGMVALDTVRITSTSTGWATFDVSGALGSALNGSFAIVLIGTPAPYPQGVPQFQVTFDNSESPTASQRPKFVLDYTNVVDISITGPGTTLADVPVQFNASLLDVDTNIVQGTVEWSTTDGTISSAGLFTPDQNGSVTISARFGRVIVDHIIFVQPGTPITLIGGPFASTITADETVSFWVDILDANGNSVPGETVTLSFTNGSIAEGAQQTTPVGALTFMPWQVGVQWVNASWGTESLNMQVTVTQGVPDYLVMAGHAQIPAGETRDFNWTAYDSHDNPITPFRVGSVNWSVENGSISAVGGYSAYTVGFWNLTLMTGVGLNATQLVETTHGAIADLELTESNNSLTVDEAVTFETVRIDVRGNRLNVTLPLEAWAWSNGSLFAEDPVRWTPWVASAQWVEATLEGVTTRVDISALHGEAVGIRLKTPSTDLISGESVSLDAFAFDQFNNEWTGTVDNWDIVEPMAGSWLTTQTSYADFEAVIVGDWTVKAIYMHDGTQVMSDEVMYTVTPGPLASITVAGHGSQLTADDSVTLNPVTRDSNQNLLSTDLLRWFMWDATSPTTQPPSCVEWGTELTSNLQANAFVWEASTEGTWKICASSGAYQTIIEVTVSHGIAAVLSDENTGDTLVAGASLSIQITATDDDGNSFAVEVSWSGGNTADFTDDEDIGAYTWAAKVAGDHTLTYTHDATGLQGTWDVEVTPSILATFTMAVTPGTTVAQQQTITVDIRAFDGFGNEIPVADSAYLDKGNELHTMNKVNKSQWTVYMLAEGTTTITVVAENVHVSEAITVQGNLLGFFEAGGWLYYLGAALGAFILLGIIVVLVVLLRRGGDDEDDYDDYYEEEEEHFDEDEVESYDEPTVSEAGYGGAEEYPATDAGEGDQPISVDEDGTEWWEDDEGVWWYRSPDMEDWAVWED